MDFNRSKYLTSAVVREFLLQSCNWKRIILTLKTAARFVIVEYIHIIESIYQRTAILSFVKDLKPDFIESSMKVRGVCSRV